MGRSTKERIDAIVARTRSGGGEIDRSAPARAGRWPGSARSIMGRQVAPKQAMDWLKPDAPEIAKRYVKAGVTLAALGLPTNLDNWGGYPAARARFLKSAQAANANLVVLSGDSHNAWAYDLAQDGRPAGVEFAGHAVTSPGYESSTAADPKAIARALVETNAELKWCDTSRRGYMALTLTPDRSSGTGAAARGPSRSDCGIPCRSSIRCSGSIRPKAPA